METGGIPQTGWAWNSSFGLGEAGHWKTRDKKQARAIDRFSRNYACSIRTVTRWSCCQEACSDLGSRLFMRIRDKLGLAYYVGAQNFAGLAPGYFAFYVGTMPEKVELVERNY